MLRTIKLFAVLFVTTALITITSCIDVEEPDPRTPEIEAAELQEIIGNIVADGKDIDSTELGIYYVIDSLGTGEYPQPGDTCFMEYVGFLLDGSIFDGSEYHYADSIWEFIFKDPELPLISGFDDGIALMNKGTELYMIIPSEHAYGETGDESGLIPPYSSIIFSAKMHDIKPSL